MGVADRWKDWDEPQQGGGVRFMAPRLTSAVRLLMFINLGFFLALWLLPKFFGVGGGESEASDWAYSVFGLSPGDWQLPYLPAWQFLSYGVLHGSLHHLFWNMLMLYFFGTMLEGMLGKSRFLTAYVVGMLAGAFLHVIAFFIAPPDLARPAVGASGAILGVVVACAVYRPNQTVLFFFIPLSLKVLVSCLVAFDVYMAVEGMSGARSDTAHWIHLGGAAFGFFGARLGWLQQDYFARYQARKAIKVEEQRKGDAEVVDHLLEKISKEGLGSLSDKEKEALKRASGRKKG